MTGPFHRVGLRGRWLARAEQSPAFEPLEARLLLSANGPVVINEIHYDPDVKTEPAEYVELYNVTNDPVDLVGWSLADAVDYTFGAGTILGPGEFLVVAQDPATVQAKWGVAALGPWVGQLSNEGEEVELRDATGVKRDAVDYGAGFPWPTVGDAPGLSIELINPGFDNDLGGNWRSSAGSPGTQPVLFETDESWRYFKGTQEPSANPGDWRQLAFDDTAWLTGDAAIGYGEAFVATELADMRGGYTTVYLRKTFNVTDPAAVSSLLLEAQYDDGINVWINGQFVADANVPGQELAFNATANAAIENHEFVPFNVADPASVLVEGVNVIAVQLVNASLSGSSDAFINARLVASTDRDAGATPGAVNSVFAANAAPQMRQVSHGPQQPTSGQDVTVTVKVTDPQGVANVTLEYQLVDPGNYINLDDPAYATDWTAMAMLDDGAGGDVLASDDVYTAVLPAALQTHRRLVRYRITAEDTLGAAVTGPYANDPQPNFAYFVYDGVPDWTGADRPGVTGDVTYSGDMLDDVAAYHLITKKQDTLDAQYLPGTNRSSGYRGSDYLWQGTLVYDGQVYDHIHFRARGGTWRYAMGKNMWKFDFNRGHEFAARDNYGSAYDFKWDKLNLGANIQQGDYLHRGEQGLFESVGFRLFNLTGVESPNTNFVQLRVIDDTAETGGSQFDTDFWGLYLAVEQPDGNLLDEHGLPDGNLYKMEGGTGTLNNQGPTQPTDRSDLDAFQAGYSQSGQSDQWFADNMDLDRYYSYRAIVEGIHHYDIGYGKNYFFYHDPVTDKWTTHPWDLDLTWANNMYGNGAEPFRDRVLPREPFGIDYRNRLREIRDLLYNGEQAGMLIDEMASFIYTAGQPSFVDADRAMWDYNPILVSGNVNPSKAKNGRFYESSPTGDFAGMVQLMKDYVGSRGQWIDSNLLTDENLAPDTPTLTYIGDPGFAKDQLTVQSSAFSDGTGDFAAMQWRLAEVTDPASPGFDPAAPRLYEINATWDSGELTTFDDTLTVPATQVTVGKTYRVRVRMKDDTGRWSHWSDPVQFVAAQAQTAALEALRITELNYHPFDPTAAELAVNPNFNDDDFEFVELQNTGNDVLDLTGVRFTDGITFDFTGSNVTSLQPGQYVVIVEDMTAFDARYGTAVNVAGVYANNLSNSGEGVTLIDALNQPIHNFVFDDADPWPTSADGGGPTLEVIDTEADYNDPANWRASSTNGGSPGSDQPADLTPPTVTQLLVRGSAWHASFIDQIAPAGGDAYAVPVGSGDQLQTLPWTGVDRVSLVFSEEVIVQSADLTLTGVNVSSYAIAGFAYDPATFTATWSLAAPIGADKLMLHLSDNVHDPAGHALDGEWDNPADKNDPQSDTYPSGDTAAGGAFSFRFNVLPTDADANDSVDIFDTLQTRNRQFTAAGQPNYSSRHDADGNGSINIFDTLNVRNRQFTTLPAAEPAVTGEPANVGGEGGQTTSGQTAAKNARDLGVLAGAAQFDGFVADTGRDADRYDYYRFTLTAPATFTAALTNLTDNADLTLFDETLTELARSNSAGVADEAIARPLPPGTYFIRVNAAAGAPAANYRLTLAAM